MNYPKISIVTVSLNCREYIEECIQSVTQQNYPNLEYIIVDGGSTDGTLDIIYKYRNKISYFISEPDKGPADALNKGFAKSSGTIMGWLNADDRMHVNSLFAVAQIFDNISDVNWVMGYPTWFNATGTCMNEIFYHHDKFYNSFEFISDNLNLKFARWGKWRFALGDFSAIQQESVFWRKSLWDAAGGYVNESLIAHDLELWTRFFLHAPLYTTTALLGGFRVHGNQLSEIHRDRYRSEAQQYIAAFKKQLLAKTFVHKARLPLAKLTKLFYYYDIPFLKKAYPYLLELPPYIVFDFHKDRFIFSE